jgi:hypothetical protein
MKTFRGLIFRLSLMMPVIFFLESEPSPAQDVAMIGITNQLSQSELTAKAYQYSMAIPEPENNSFVTLESRGGGLGVPVTNRAAMVSDAEFYKRFRYYVWSAEGMSQSPRMQHFSALEKDARYLSNFRSLAKEALTANAFVIGGVTTQPGEFQDCMALRWGDGTPCTGVLIASNAILTAAHCKGFSGYPKVYFGQDPYQTSPVGIVTNAYTDNYQADGPLNDILLLMLSSDLPFPPAQIATFEELQTAKNVWLVGFGIFDLNTGEDGIKHKVKAPLGSFGCQDSGCNYPDEFVAGRPGLGKDTCAGDSGGPAYIETTGGWKLAGLTSRPIPSTVGNPCGDGGIYVRVDSYSSWLASRKDIHWRTQPGGNL